MRYYCLHGDAEPRLGSVLARKVRRAVACRSPRIAPPPSFARSTRCIADRRSTRLTARHVFVCENEQLSWVTSARGRIICSRRGVTQPDAFNAFNASLMRFHLAIFAICFSRATSINQVSQIATICCRLHRESRAQSQTVRGLPCRSLKVVSTTRPIGGARKRYVRQPT